MIKLLNKPEYIIIYKSPEGFGHKIFFKYKYDNECLGIVNINKNELLFTQTHHLEFDVRSYFKNVKDIQVPWEGLSTSTWEIQKPFIRKLVAYIKDVWLTREFIQNNGFNNPIGILWNPRGNVWNIHPGGARQKILHYFGGDNLEVICFNTGGKKIDFIKKFNSLNDIKEYFNNKDINLVVVPDHGSLIPHIHFDQLDIWDIYEREYKKLFYFFNNTKIIANFDLSDFFYTEPENYSKIVKVTVDDPNDLINKTKAFFMLPSFNNINKYNVKIEKIQ